MTNIKEIQNDSFGILNKIKKMKKMIRNKLEYAEEVNIHYSTAYPMLIVSYYAGNMKLYRSHHHLR